jgi:chromosome segregation ATPase
MELDEAEREPQGQLTDDDLLESPASPPVQRAAKRARHDFLEDDKDLLDDGSPEPRATSTTSRHDAEATSRVVLRSIDICGFKSFRDPITIDLCPSLSDHSKRSLQDPEPARPVGLLSCILGGNGVGKSACVDAVLFVLGHGASQLRSHKVEQLISEGADSVKVTLHFARISTARSAHSHDGSAESEQRLTACRAISSSNSSSSTYSLNGRVKSKADTLAAISAFCGCDMSCPDKFVMRQGATLVAQRGPLDLLSFFEDLAGTKPLKEAITVTQSQLDTAVTAAITLDESILAVEDKRRVLEPQVQKFKQYQAALSELEAAQSAVQLYEAANLSAAVTAAGEEVERTREYLQCAKTEHAELEPLVKEASAVHQTATTEVNSVKPEHKAASTAVTKADALAAELQAKAARCAMEVTAKQKEVKRVSTLETKGTSEKEKIEQRLTVLTADELKLQHAFENNDSAVNDAIDTTAEHDTEAVSDTDQSASGNTDVCREDKQALLDQKQRIAAEEKSLQAAQTELAVSTKDHNDVNELLQSKRERLAQVQADMSVLQESGTANTASTTSSNSSSGTQHKAYSTAPTSREHERLAAMRQLVAELQSSDVGVVGVLNELVHVKQDVHSAAVNAVMGSRLRNTFVVRTRSDATALLDAAPGWLGLIR